MSQFQQPQDNRYVRPGVQDLGTGRRFERLSVSQRGEGSLGSGAQGGGFVQGQSRTGTGLSGVDPLAQILGAASGGINAFLDADQTIVRARDAQGHLELDKLERDYAEALAQPEANPKALAADYREKLNNYRSSRGKLPERGTAGKRFDKMRKDAIHADETFNYNDAKRKLDTAIVNASGDARTIVTAINRFREDMEPYNLERAISDTQGQLNAAQGQLVMAETGRAIKDARAKFDSRLRTDGFFNTIQLEGGGSREEYNVDKILEFAQLYDVSMEDDDAMQRLTAAFLRYHEEDFVDLDPQQQIILMDGWSDMFMKEAGGMIDAARTRLQIYETNERVAETSYDFRATLRGESSLPGYDDPFLPDSRLHSTLDMSPESRREAKREDTMAAFARRAGAWRETQGNRMSALDSPAQSEALKDLLFTDSIAAAEAADGQGNHATAIDILLNAHDAIPLTAAEAQAAGWLGNLVPSPDDPDRQTNMTEEAWSVQRKKLVKDLRAAQLKASEGVFAAAVDANHANPTGLSNLMSQLWLLAGPDDTEGYSFDRLGQVQAGTDFINPLKYSSEATPFQKTYNYIAETYNKYHGTASPEFHKSRTFLNSFNDPNASAHDARTASGLSTNPSKKTIAATMGGPLPGFINGNGTFDDVRVWINEQVESGAGLTPVEQRLAVYLSQMEESGRSFKDDLAAQGTLFGMIDRAYADTVGTRLPGDLSVVVSEESTIWRENLFAGVAPGQTVKDPRSAMGVSAYWDSLMIPGTGPDDEVARARTLQLRKEAFGDNYESAKLTAAWVRSKGGRWDPTASVYKKEDGSKFDGLEFSFNRELEKMNDGHAALSGQLKTATGQTPEEFVEDLVSGIMNPLLLAADAGASPYSLSGMKEVLETLDSGFRDEIHESLGLHGSSDTLQIQLTPVEQANINAQVQLDLYDAVGSGRVDFRDPEALAKEVALRASFHITSHFSNRTIVGNEIVEDSSGVLESLASYAESNEPDAIFNHVRRTPLSSLAEATGRSRMWLMSPDAKANNYGVVFYETLDLPGEQFPADYLARSAMEMHNISDPDRLTVDHLLKAHFVLNRGTDPNTPISPDSFAEAQADSVEGRLSFAFPNIISGGGTDLTFTGVSLKPMNHYAGGTFRWPSASLLDAEAVIEQVEKSKGRKLTPNELGGIVQMERSNDLIRELRGGTPSPWMRLTDWIFGD